MLCCAVLCCAVLCCAVLYCIVLYCIVLYCIVLYCIVLYCIVYDFRSRYSSVHVKLAVTLRAGTFTRRWRRPADSQRLTPVNSYLTLRWDHSDTSSLYNNYVSLWNHPEHETLIPCWLNAGLASQMMDQQKSFKLPRGRGPSAVVEAACLKSRRSHSSFKETKCFFSAHS